MRCQQHMIFPNIPTVQVLPLLIVGSQDGQHCTQGSRSNRGRRPCTFHSCCPQIRQRIRHSIRPGRICRRLTTQIPTRMTETAPPLVPALQDWFQHPPRPPHPPGPPRLRRRRMRSQAPRSRSIVRHLRGSHPIKRTRAMPTPSSHPLSVESLSPEPIPTSTSRVTVAAAIASAPAQRRAQSYATLVVHKSSLGRCHVRPSLSEGLVLTCSPGADACDSAYAVQRYSSR